MLPSPFCGFRMTLILVARRNGLQPIRYPHLSTLFWRGAALSRAVAASGPYAPDPDEVGWRYDVRRVAEALVVDSWWSCREAAARKCRHEILPGRRLCDGGPQRLRGCLSSSDEKGTAGARGGRARPAR